MDIRRVVFLVLILVAFGAAEDKPAAAGDKQTVVDKPAATDTASDTHNPLPPASAAQSSDYVIGDSDVLAINVWHEQELTRVVPVRPDGKISLPLLGDVQASGLTPVQLQAKLTEQLRDLLENPEVTVIVQEALSRHFNIVGEVVKPGSYSITQPMRVLDAIALAGGFRDFAKVGKMYVLRAQTDGSSKRLPVKYKRAIQGDLAENFPLQPRDTVVVP